MRLKQANYVWSESRRFPEPGESLRIVQHGRILVTGQVIAADNISVTISTRNQKLVDLDTILLFSGVRDGSIKIEHLDT